MSAGKDFRELALSMPYALEKAHFDRTGVRANAPRGKMLATMSAEETEANVFLSMEEREILCEAEPDVFYTVPNKWSEKGATTVRVSKASTEILKLVILMSWRSAAPPKVLKEYDA